MREKASSHKSSALPQGFFYYHSRSFAKLFHPPSRLRPRQARPPGSSACLGGMGGRAVAALCVFGSGSAHPTARRPGTVPSGSACLSPPQSHPRGSGRFCLAARLFPPSRREGMAARQSRPLCVCGSVLPAPPVRRPACCSGLRSRRASLWPGALLACSLRWKGAQARQVSLQSALLVAVAPGLSPSVALGALSVVRRIASVVRWPGFFRGSLRSVWHPVPYLSPWLSRLASAIA